MHIFQIVIHYKYLKIKMAIPIIIPIISNNIMMKLFETYHFFHKLIEKRISRIFDTTQICINKYLNVIIALGDGSSINCTN